MIGLDSMSFGIWDGIGLEGDQNQGGESASAYVQIIIHGRKVR